MIMKQKPIGNRLWSALCTVHWWLTGYKNWEDSDNDELSDSLYYDFWFSIEDKINEKI